MNNNSPNAICLKITCFYWFKNILKRTLKGERNCYITLLILCNAGCCLLGTYSTKDVCIILKKNKTGKFVFTCLLCLELDISKTGPSNPEAITESLITMQLKVFTSWCMFS